MSTKSTTPAPSFLQVYTQVRRNRMEALIPSPNQ